MAYYVTPSFLCVQGGCRRELLLWHFRFCFHRSCNEAKFFAVYKAWDMKFVKQPSIIMNSAERNISRSIALEYLDGSFLLTSERSYWCSSVNDGCVRTNLKEIVFININVGTFRANISASTLNENSGTVNNNINVNNNNNNIYKPPDISPQ